MTNESPLRVLFLPHEIGDQMQLMAEALRAKGHFATAATILKSSAIINDIMLDQYHRKGRIRHYAGLYSFFFWALQNFEIFHFHWGRSLLRQSFAPHLDLPLLSFFRKKIFVHFRGSDIRNPEYFNFKTRQYRGLTESKPPFCLSHQLSSLRKWKKYADKIFVSEPGLMEIIPDAVEVPQIIDLTKWIPYKSDRNDSVFRVAHAPSKRSNKGTEFIIQAVDSLKNEGYKIELVIFEGIKHGDIGQLYSSCDIGIDQVLYSWYGKVALEMMAMGIPVICNITEEWRKYRSFLPIVRATPDCLKDKLRHLIANPSEIIKVSTDSREYVRAYHSPDAVSDLLLEQYKKIY